MNGKHEKRTPSYVNHAGRTYVDLDAGIIVFVPADGGDWEYWVAGTAGTWVKN